MNTPTDTTQSRPGFWLRAIEHRKRHLTHEYRATLGDSARAGISDEDYATTLATLEKMARNLGWDESEQEHRLDGRPGGPRRGGHRHGGHGHGGHDRGGHGHHDRGRSGRMPEREPQHPDRHENGADEGPES